MIFDRNQKIIAEKTKADEIEIRAKISSAEIMQKLAKMTGEPEIIDSISMTYPVSTDCDYRRESFYVNKKKSRHEDIKKCKVAIIKLESFDISFANETPVDDFKVTAVKTIRFKHRLRYSLLNGYLDFTRVQDFPAHTPKILNNFTDLFLANEVGEWKLELELKETSNLNNSVIEFGEFLGMNDFANFQLREIANLMKISPKFITVKHLGVNPVMLSRHVFSKIKLDDYVILEKSDGLRAFLKLYDVNNYVILSDTKIQIEGTISDEPFSLFDCEWMENGLKIFDLILADGELVAEGYEKRLEMVADMKLPSICTIKKYYPATCENIEHILKHTDHIDGVIFNQRNRPYLKMEIFKWKPADQITFDFLVIPLPANYKGIQPFVGDENMYILMTGCLATQIKRTGIKMFKRYRELLLNNGILYESYNPIPFSPPVWRDAYLWKTSETFDKMFVGEFRVVSKKWEFIKAREDKLALVKSRVFGNDYFVAEKHINEIQNPLTVKELCEKQGSGYFANEKPVEYEQMTKFNGKVKYEILQVLESIESILDIGSGKGQDVFKYPKCGRITFLEPDKIAFIELNERLKKAKNFKHFAVNDSYENYIKLPNQFAAIVSNFACHYFLKNEVAYCEFAKFCVRANAQLVILTFMNVDAMKLPLKNDKYDIYREKDQLYVKHHFSNEYYPEFIIYTEKLIKAMKKEKYTLMVRDSFGHFLEYAELSNELDKEYVSYYQYLIFRR